MTAPMPEKIKASHREGVEDFASSTAYTFKEEDIEKTKALLGQYAAWPYREQFTVATNDVMRNFSRSYGDDNPLFNDESYGAETRWGAQIAPPMIPVALNSPLLDDGPKFRQPSFRGIHVFVSGGSWTWYRPLLAGDQVYSIGGYESVTEKKSAFAERSLIVTMAFVKMNQRAEVVAVQRVIGIYTERNTARKKGKYAAIEAARYTEEELAAIDEVYSNERVRGPEKRWWEDVEVGEELTPIAKGPLTTTDIIVFHSGGYGFVPYAPSANRIAYKNRQRIKPFYVTNEYGIPDVAQRVHWDSAWAQAIGNPMAFDYGVMRECHLTHLCTDWMGDDGFLMHLSSEIRKFNYIGDTHIISGEVVAKRIDEDSGNSVVDIEMRGTNQRSEITCPGKAVVALPSRERGEVKLPPPPIDLQQQAIERMARHAHLKAQAGGRGDTSSPH